MIPERSFRIELPPTPRGIWGLLSARPKCKAGRKASEGAARKKGFGPTAHARTPSAPLAPPREREPPAEVLRCALPGVVWSVPPRVCGLPAAAAAASDPGVRSDVTAMAGIKGGPGELGAGGLGDRPEGGRRGSHAAHARCRPSSGARHGVPTPETDPGPPPPPSQLGSGSGRGALFERAAGTAVSPSAYAFC